MRDVPRHEIQLACQRTRAQMTRVPVVDVKSLQYVPHEHCAEADWKQLFCRKKGLPEHALVHEQVLPA